MSAATGWLLTKPPSSDPGLHGRLRDGLTRDGYLVADAGADWQIRRKQPPPNLIAELSLRMVPEGTVGGSPVDLERRLSNWWNPTLTIGNIPAELVDDYLNKLEELDNPQRNPVKWSKANELAGFALSGALPSRLPEILVRVERVYRRWIPKGQLIVWERQSEYMAASRLVHVFGSADLIGTGAALEAVLANRAWWMHGEDLVHAPLGTLYMDLIPSGMAGVAWETVPYIFLFEFGEYRQVAPAPLDALNLWRLHSFFGAEYTAVPPARWRIPATSPLGRDGIRSWFVSGVNRLAQYAIGLENFRTDAGRIRPAAEQQAYLTIARILVSSALLFASWEPHLQRLAFWDLVDLYAGLKLTGVAEAVGETLSRGEWQGKVVPGVATLPGSLGSQWGRVAKSRHQRWVQELVAGVIVPSRLRRGWVLVGSEGNLAAERSHEFFTHHLEARRHTLHGYYPWKAEKFRNYLAIHDGRLPSSLPQWGRFRLMALLANPQSFLEAFSRIELPKATPKLP